MWRIHRRIGMSGGLFINALLRETEEGVTVEQVARIQALHAEAYQAFAPQVRPLPGARELLAALTAAGVPWGIATSGIREGAQPVLHTLGVPDDVPVVTRALGVGLLSGGYGRAELETAGAYRVYDDPADLLLHLDEVGVRGAV